MLGPLYIKSYFFPFFRSGVGEKLKIFIWVLLTSENTPMVMKKGWGRRLGSEQSTQINQKNRGVLVTYAVTPPSPHPSSRAHGCGPAQDSSSHEISQFKLSLNDFWKKYTESNTRVEGFAFYGVGNDDFLNFANIYF